MIMTSHYLDLVTAETVKLLQQKSADATQVTACTRFLGGDVDMDSLDLATLIVELEEASGKRPFRAGFRAFFTVGELASLFENCE